MDYFDASDESPNSDAHARLTSDRQDTCFDFKADSGVTGDIILGGDASLVRILEKRKRGEVTGTQIFIASNPLALPPRLWGNSKGFRIDARL